jgi:hypothetical protein
VAFVLQPVWYRANAARIHMIEGDRGNLMQLYGLSGAPTKELMDAMAELVPTEEGIIRTWTYKDPKNGHLGCGCVCGSCAAIMRLGARRGDVPGAIDGAAVSVQRAVSTYPAGLRDQTTGDSLEDLAGMRVPHTLENIQWQQACTYCNMQEDFSKRDRDASGIAQVVTQAIVEHLRLRGVLAEYMMLAKVASLQERGALRTVLFQRQTAATANLCPVQYQGGLKQPPIVEWELASPSERKWLREMLEGGPIVFDFGREPVQFGHLLKHMPRKDTGDEHTDFG